MTLLERPHFYIINKMDEVVMLQCRKRGTALLLVLATSCLKKVNFQLSRSAVYYITLHYMTLHCIHSIPFHSIPFHSVAFHSIAFHSIPFHYWVSEANPTLGCSIEISRDIYIFIGRAKRAPHWGVQSRFRVIYICIYIYICVSVVCQITWNHVNQTRACSKSVLGGKIRPVTPPYYSFRL